MSPAARFEHYRAQIDSWLDARFESCQAPGDLYDAMRYSLLGGGKRIRPVLLLEACRMCGGEASLALPFAGAVEMIHTYSLIHDDLPCMDDDDLRRGRPTNHKVYGEATAVLAGDGLLTAAFESMLEAEGVPPERVVAAAACLGRAAGARGMVGGQAMDMAGEGRALRSDEVEELQRLKTGALITAAAEMGCILAGGGEEARLAVRSYGEKLGLAFQVQDDILDVVGDAHTLGKPTGSDSRSEKTTLVTLRGVEACRRLVRELTEEAKASLERFGPLGDGLRRLADTLAERER